MLTLTLALVESPKLRFHEASDGTHLSNDPGGERPPELVAGAVGGEHPRRHAAASAERLQQRHVEQRPRVEDACGDKSSLRLFSNKHLS